MAILVLVEPHRSHDGYLQKLICTASPPDHKNAKKLLNSVRLFSCSLLFPSKEGFFFVTAATHKISRCLSILTQMSCGNCSSTETLCKDTIYVLLFIAPLPFGFLKKAATAKAFLCQSCLSTLASSKPRSKNTQVMLKFTTQSI